MVAVLYDETPQHRDNFLKLAREGYYDGTLFHRVIKDFMVQGGDPDSKGAPAGKQLGMGGPSYTIPAEMIYPKFYHKKGALAAARTGDEVNPERRSSGSQFYIVTGKVYKEGELVQMEKQMQMQQLQQIFNDLCLQHRDEIITFRKNRDQAGLQALQEKLEKETYAKAGTMEKAAIPAEIRQAYTTVGGTPFLDNQYSVFGEVIEGLEVVDKIQAVATAAGDRPKEDISMTVEVIES